MSGVESLTILLHIVEIQVHLKVEARASLFCFVATALHVAGLAQVHREQGVSSKLYSRAQFDVAVIIKAETELSIQNFDD